VLAVSGPNRARIGGRRLDACKEVSNIRDEMLTRVQPQTGPTSSIRKAFAVYGGDHALQDGPVRVLPVRDFLEHLGEILPG
jgi:hypothetical protein